jgi:hypothetical protein
VGERIWAVAIGAVILLTSCGRPDASGLYVSTSDRQAALVQLVQSKDGALAGRIEVISIASGGAVNDESSSLDGSSSAVTGDTLTIRPKTGPALKARRGSLVDFQKAAAQLKVRASQERRHVAEAQSKTAEQAAEMTIFANAKDPSARLEQAAADLEDDAAKLDQAVLAAPDFGQRSADNTSRIAQLARTAPTLAGSQRQGLIGQANQVIVETNQIDLARTRYAIGLDQIIQRASPMATSVQRFCETPEAAKLAAPCSRANAAATDFERSLVHASALFRGYKQTVQIELNRQNEMLRRMGG